MNSHNMFHVISEGERVAMDVFDTDDVKSTRIGTVSAVGTFDIEAHAFVPLGGGGVIATEGEPAWALVWFDDDPERDWPIPWPMLHAVPSHPDRRVGT
ncbi:hypothetical protein [Mycobacterium sp. OTB74]|uniref:hypothetical protein n=1 Tax=Mycobacterium sp. OTB74 TaxID=1853452 RepID=UPI00247553A4|nr:hypothetical protein [Mycobacterium sp. OTB74]